METKSLRDIGLMYDEQFNRNMKIAKFLLKNLSNKKEVQLATKWLVRVSNIKSSVIEVKKNRNAFLSCVVKVLRDGALRGCLASESNTVCDPDNTFSFLDHPDESTPITMKETLQETVNQSRVKFHSKWSDDHRTYVAVKPIAGQGAFVYMAVSKVPGIDNWDLPAPKKCI